MGAKLNIFMDKAGTFAVREGPKEFARLRDSYGFRTRFIGECYDTLLSLRNRDSRAREKLETPDAICSQIASSAGELKKARNDYLASKGNDVEPARIRVLDRCKGVMASFLAGCATAGFSRREVEEFVSNARSSERHHGDHARELLGSISRFANSLKIDRVREAGRSAVAVLKNLAEFI